MKYYTVQEIADMLYLHPETIRLLIRSGDLKAIKLGKGWKIREEELKKYLESKEKENA